MMKEVIVEIEVTVDEDQIRSIARIEADEALYQHRYDESHDRSFDEDEAQRWIINVAPTMPVERSARCDFGDAVTTVVDKVLRDEENVEFIKEIVKDAIHELRSFDTGQPMSGERVECQNTVHVGDQVETTPDPIRVVRDAGMEITDTPFPFPHPIATNLTVSDDKKVGGCVLVSNPEFGTYVLHEEDALNLQATYNNVRNIPGWSAWLLPISIKKTEEQQPQPLIHPPSSVWADHNPGGWAVVVNEEGDPRVWVERSKEAAELDCSNQPDRYVLPVSVNQFIR